MKFLKPGKLESGKEIMKVWGDLQKIQEEVMKVPWNSLCHVMILLDLNWRCWWTQVDVYNGH